MKTQKDFQMTAPQRVREKRGQTLVEYALIIAFVCVVAIASLLTVRANVQGAYTSIDAQLNQSQNGGVTASTRN